MAEDYCDLCDLPLSTCVHGMPAPPPKAAPPPRTVRTSSTATRLTGRPPIRPARPASRRTDQSAFRPHILAVLRDAGTPLETDEMLLELEIRLDGQLKERDVEKAPTGEVRWHTSARAERKTMIDQGLIVAAQPGIWELTPRGRATG